MSRSVREYLKHIKDEISYLEVEKAGLDKVGFVQDETQNAPLSAALKLSAKLRKISPRIYGRIIPK